MLLALMPFFGFRYFAYAIATPSYARLCFAMLPCAIAAAAAIICLRCYAADTPPLRHATLCIVDDIITLTLLILCCFADVVISLPP